MTVDELERQRTERLVLVLMEHLRNNQGVNVAVELIEDVDRWRRAARLAGHRLGISVRTGISRDGTTIWVSEGPESDLAQSSGVTSQSVPAGTQLA
jgi:hypothetical protein